MGHDAHWNEDDLGNEPQDDMAPARGLIVGLLLVTPFWCLVALGIYLYLG